MSKNKKQLTLKVKEIFYSLQGEGALTGMPTIFIRLVGCNMHCPYCDTDFSAVHSDIMTLEKI
jgi:7-carboxy-7-deazaguanine synthase